MAGWHLLPVVVLRQAGFPFDLLAAYADPKAGWDAAEITELEADARDRAADLKQWFRAVGLPDRAVVASWLGHLRPFGEDALTDLAARLPADAARGLFAYQDRAVRLGEHWDQWEIRHRERLADAAIRLVGHFDGDDRLRDALLMSNDAQFALIASWLVDPGDPGSGRGRKLTDLLARYLQRFCAKNETHSHFGPIAVGRASADAARAGWRPGPLKRRTFFSHWAAERVAEALSARPDQLDRVPVRRRPWAFLVDGRIHLYAFTTERGLAADWRFRPVTVRPVTDAERLLFELCDAETSVAQLRAEFTRRGVEGFDEALAALADEGFVVRRIEVPVGLPDPLAGLRERVSGDPAASALVGALQDGTRAVGTVGLVERPAALARVKELFEAATGESPNRGSGRHYADRSVLYEECHAPVEGFTLGRSVTEFVEGELTPIYDMVLAAPRLRIVRERVVLTEWLTDRFGPGARIDLADLYRAYFEDQPALSRRCDGVDAELDRLDQELTMALLGDADGDPAEVVVAEERLREMLARCPDGPAALCNPDIMLAAEDVDALDRGDFLAVVGDCHATRELLTHSSLAPLVREREPDVADQVAAAYHRLLEPDEVLCDLARSHPDKTATQLALPVPDVEIFGRSPRPRREVIQPRRMYVTLGERAELRAEGVDGRLRLLAPPSGAPSIRRDPLAPFAFPRRLGGLGLRAETLAHVPRIRAGRVVLQRELWRLAPGEFAGVGPAGVHRRGDAAEFYAACRLRDRHRLPRYVFAKVAGEPKPIFVDFDSPLFVRQLFRLARGATAPVELSEMLPRPDQLWFQREGGRFTTEIRCAVFSAPAADRRGAGRNGTVHDA
ncbi:lantibiotic dehydratase [Micromonospora sp. NPDC049836]|uniref:lantibiotic dehydratase n=1 Tax=Micromonospora sp. NPDC049836 TaxID=3364274 RepID=UPI0037AB3CD2